jgi:hypothetical protein
MNKLRFGQRRLQARIRLAPGTVCGRSFKPAKPDETATVLFYDGNLKLYLLHRQRGLAKLLYHPLGFRMDERIQRMRPVRGHSYISIAPERLD